MSERTALHDWARTCFELSVTPSVSIDPNSIYRSDPALTVAEIGDANGPVSPGDEVIAVQEGGGEDPDYVGSGRVVKVNREHGLLYLDVDWDSFRSRPAPAARQMFNAAVHILSGFSAPVQSAHLFGVPTAEAEEEEGDTVGHAHAVLYAPGMTQELMPA
ncbi:hypothetical protein [Rhodococcus qingshengii]|uniref:hypothetical protein n=1 Tax=Rhodococcus qingshengii TaxID=334542 RepID=UPI00210ABC9F|nr:hypothetical protein [Rhodococcus qingshengii]MCQ4148565.1 hypothetical protein [Rhodococcus qingshengii]